MQAQSEIFIEKHHVNATLTCLFYFFRCSFNFNLNTVIPNVNVIYFGLYYIWQFAHHSRL